MVHFPKEAEHSEKYTDDLFEYKHVIVTKEMYDKMSKNKLFSETEWRAMGIAQSRGWIHYTIHKPEPHILLFKRPVGTDPKTGEVPMDVLHKIALSQKNC
jgi:cyclin-dependent kinase regulatory subunit CKS1